MRESSLPDPRLRKAMDALDQTRKELRAERIRSANLRHALTTLRQGLAADAKPKPEQRPAC
jgi:hypothetical protein